MSNRDYMQAIALKNKEVLVIGLTGKAGIDLAGITSLLTGEQFSSALIQPFLSDDFEPWEMRDYRNVERYMRFNWVPFVEVSMNAVMISFLLDMASDYYGRQGASEDDLPGESWAFGIKGVGQEEKLNPVKPFAIIDELLKAQSGGTSEFKERAVRRMDAVHAAIAKKCEAAGDNRLSNDGYREKVNDALDWLTKDGANLKTLVGVWDRVTAAIEARDFKTLEPACVCLGLLPELALGIDERLSRHDDHLAALFYQQLGNEIRAYGTPAGHGTAAREAGGHIFDLPRRASKFCKVVRHYRGAFVGEGDPDDGKWNPANIVVSPFKNQFETLYFRKRYSSFCLLAVTGESNPEAVRTTLRVGGYEEMGYVGIGENSAAYGKSYRDFVRRHIRRSRERYGVEFDVDSAEWRAKCAKGAFEKAEGAGLGPAKCGLTESEYEYAKYVFAGNPLRHECYMSDSAPFALQDIVSCIEGADVFMTRDTDEPVAAYDSGFVRSLTRFATLASHPGLLKPTPVERCMQAAMSAKLNSGCLSRQVGAVVTDSRYNILSLGWNDAPCGSESCARRNLKDVVNKFDSEAYSDYELTDPSFRSYVEAMNREGRLDDALRGLGGLPAAYCFKDLYQAGVIGRRDPMHTRALHAEERAIGSCAPERVRGGYLFTTSSPCELCAKRAKEAGIKRIYYIERYPGISHAHVIDDGPEGLRAEYEFFVGVTGAAYMRLYTPTVPYKDELAALGLSPASLCG